MLFDLKKFFNTGNSPHERVFEVDLTAKDFSGAKITEPVCTNFVAELVGDEVDLTLTATAHLKTNCARCLEEIKKDETISAQWTVKERDLEDPDFELPLDEKGKLNVEEWLYQEFMFQIPTVLLCSADCTGLCQICGQKQESCVCEKTNETSAPIVDERLSVLKSLLD